MPIILLLLLGLLTIPFSAMYAQTHNSENHTITPQERAVFAFFRVIKDAPDYDFWIKSQPQYTNLSEKKREKYLISETLRLGRGFGDFDHETDILALQLDVYTKFQKETEEEPAHIKFRILESPESYAPSFDFPYGTDVISLLINKLAIFSNLPLTHSQSESIKKVVPHENDEFKSKMEIHVRITRADKKDPIIHADKKQWLMIGEIAYIKNEYSSPYNDETKKIWDYIAPWYEEEFRLKNMPEEEKYPHPYDLFKD